MHFFHCRLAKGINLYTQHTQHQNPFRTQSNQKCHVYNGPELLIHDRQSVNTVLTPYYLDITC